MKEIAKDLTTTQKLKISVAPYVADKLFPRLDKLTYPTRLEGKVNALAARNILDIIVKNEKRGVKFATKAAAKYVAKIIPWIAAGVIGKELYDRVKDLVTKDEKSESNTIPHGEFYHRNKGWY